MLLILWKIKLIMEWYIKVIKSYSDFNGRARRKEYWMFTLWNFIFALLAVLLDYSFGIVYPLVGYGPLYIAYALFVLVPGIAVAVRRLHDIGKSGWMYLVAFIPIAGFILLLILFIKEGDQGNNAYGEDPKEL
ncbi:MAG: DUF805 domain-containing protein [Flavobacteriales bacterium]|jgi:uncharacterized membrane protein YhaH (DUF805 family)|nr:DUF805 domain-containing protein [Flavobacteriales bacterium]